MRRCGATIGWVGVLSALMLLSTAGAQTLSNRTIELVRRNCETTIGRQEVTLFANGTLRIRQRANAKEQFKLAELNPEELEAFVNRLSVEDLSEVPRGRPEVQGDFIERCELHLELADQAPREFHFGRFDSLPLALSRLNRIVDDMALLADSRSPVMGLPRDYVPRAGDVLERADGMLFEVVGYTSDKRGVELTGVNEPLTIFIATEALHDSFVSVVAPHRWP